MMKTAFLCVLIGLVLVTEVTRTTVNAQSNGTMASNGTTPGTTPGNAAVMHGTSVTMHVVLAVTGALLLALLRN